MSDIDRVLKKVNEGVDHFDEIWKKVHDPSQMSNLREKDRAEAELKKEI